MCTIFLRFCVSIVLPVLQESGKEFNWLCGFALCVLFSISRWSVADLGCIHVANRDGRIKLFGAPGIEALLQSPLRAPCKYLQVRNCITKIKWRLLKKKWRFIAMEKKMKAVAYEHLAQSLWRLNSYRRSDQMSILLLLQFMSHGGQLVNVTTQNDIEVRTICSVGTVVFCNSVELCLVLLWQTFLRFRNLFWFYVWCECWKGRLDLTRSNTGMFFF